MSTQKKILYITQWIRKGSTILNANYLKYKDNKISKIIKRLFTYRRNIKLNNIYERSRILQS